MELKQRAEIRAARASFLRIVRSNGPDLTEESLYNLLVKAYLKGRIEATKLVEAEYETNSEE